MGHQNLRSSLSVKVVMWTHNKISITMSEVASVPLDRCTDQIWRLRIISPEKMAQIKVYRLAEILAELHKIVCARTETGTVCCSQILSKTLGSIH